MCKLALPDIQNLWLVFTTAKQYTFATYELGAKVSQTKTDQVAAMDAILQPFTATIQNTWNTPHSTEGANAPWGEWRRTSTGLSHCFNGTSWLTINPSTGTWSWHEPDSRPALEGLWLGNGRQPLAGCKADPLPLTKFTQLLAITKELCNRTLGALV